MWIESYDSLEQPKPIRLNEEEKEEIYDRLSQNIAIMHFNISDISNRNLNRNFNKSHDEPQENGAIRTFLSFFNEWAKIKVWEFVFSVHEFCDRLVSWEINWEELNQLNTEVRFRRWQFIKQTILELPNGEEQFMYNRKIDFMSFNPVVQWKERYDKMLWVDDITPRTIIEQRQQASLDVNPNRFKDDDEDADEILRQIE